jgi:putative oxidoreductase
MPSSANPEPVPLLRRSLPRVMTRLQGASSVLTRASVPLLRVSLGVVFIWFGALKFTNSTPVAELVANTVPFLPARWFVPALGAFEVGLGLALLVGRWLGIVALLMVAHLSGTLLVLVTQPHVAFQDGNPLMLTMTGEFVVKNLVLMAAGLVLAAASTARASAPDAATHEPEFEPPRLDATPLEAPALNPTD